MKNVFSLLTFLLVIITGINAQKTTNSKTEVDESITGGLNFRRIAPKWLFPILAKLEPRLSILSIFSIHWVVVLEKIDTITSQPGD